MKTPQFLTQLSAVIAARKKKLNAATRAAPRAAMSDYDAEEPTTKLSSAFIVVFILHVVAIGGIYAFNGIKASRVGSAPPPPAAKENVKAAVTKDAKLPALAAAANPTAARPAESNAAATPAVSAPAPKVLGPKQYLVRTGDNPTKIAIAFGLKTDELLAANSLKEGAILHQGQPLTIPAAKLAVKPVPAEAHKIEPADIPPTRTTPGLHIVKKGDTATSIAKSYGLSAEEILKLNKIPDAKKIQLGQALKIPVKKG